MLSLYAKKRVGEMRGGERNPEHLMPNLEAGIMQT